MSEGRFILWGGIKKNVMNMDILFGVVFEKKKVLIMGMGGVKEPIPYVGNI